MVFAEPASSMPGEVARGTSTLKRSGTGSLYCMRDPFSPMLSAHQLAKPC